MYFPCSLSESWTTPQALSDCGCQRIKSSFSETISQQKVQMKKWVSCKTHAPEFPIQFVVVSQRESQLILDVWIEVVCIIAGNVFHNVDTSSFFEIANN